MRRDLCPGWPRARARWATSIPTAMTRARPTAWPRASPAAGPRAAAPPGALLASWPTSRARPARRAANGRARAARAHPRAARMGQPQRLRVHARPGAADARRGGRAADMRRRPAGLRDGLGRNVQPRPCDRCAWYTTRSTTSRGCAPYGSSTTCRGVPTRAAHRAADGPRRAGQRDRPYASPRSACSGSCARPALPRARGRPGDGGLRRRRRSRRGRGGGGARRLRAGHRLHGQRAVRLRARHPPRGARIAACARRPTRWLPAPTHSSSRRTRPPPTTTRRRVGARARPAADARAGRRRGRTARRPRARRRRPRALLRSTSRTTGPAAQPAAHPRRRARDLAVHEPLVGQRDDRP